jgi:hypothetical protein
MEKLIVIPIVTFNDEQMDQRTLSALSHLSRDMIWYRYTMFNHTRVYINALLGYSYQTIKEKYISIKPVTENAA